MSFIAGSYSVSYDGATVGQILDGVRLQHSFFKQLITGDNFAQSPQDAVFQGAQHFAQFSLMEYDNAKAATAFYPYGSAWFTMDTVIGTLDSANSMVLLLTALAGTPAAAAPATITCNLSILAEGFPVELLLAPALRTIPLRMRIYPNSSGVFGTLT